MAPKGYTTARMLALAEKALQSYVSENDGLENVMCKYLGSPARDGTYDIDASIQWDTHVAFEWTGQFNGTPRKSIVEIRCDNVIQRGVTFPPLWNFAIQAWGLQAIADESAMAFAQAFGFSNATCRILGMAKTHPIPDEGISDVPGSLVTLNAHRVGIEYLLCAQVHADYWFCSKGYFIDEHFQENDPLNPNSLVVKNIQQDMWSGPSGEAKRIRRHLHQGHLRQIATEWKDDWNLLAAVAHWRAEELRAQRDRRPIDEEVAGSRFEPDPFMWSISKRNRKQSKVGVQWTWEHHHEILQSLDTHHMHNILDRRRIVSPKIHKEDEELQRRLETAAQIESDARKAPCHYLGICLGPGKYEANPTKWPYSKTKNTSDVYIFNGNI